MSKLIPDPTVGDGDDSGPAAVAVEIFNVDNPYSIVNVVTDRVREAIRLVPDELHDLTEGELKMKCRPTGTDYSLRVSFWREYERICSTGRRVMDNRSVFGGICSERYFYMKFLTDEVKVAWLVRPIQTYQKEMESILNRGTQRLWELMEMDITDKTGKKVDPRRAEVLLKVIAEVSNRVKGMAVQRLQKDSRSLKVSVAVPPKPVQVETVEQLQRRIAELEAAKPGRALPAAPLLVEEVDLEVGDREVVNVGARVSGDV